MKGGASPATRLSRSAATVLDLEHYLDVLQRKPGALIGFKPLRAWLERGV
jgi:hypothetical protein